MSVTWNCFRSSWGNPRSIASSVDNYSRSGLSHYRRGYEEIDGSFDDPDSSRCCRCFKRVGIVIGALSVALLITAVPSVILSQQMFGLENEDAFQMFIARPEIAFPTWYGMKLKWNIKLLLSCYHKVGWKGENFTTVVWFFYNIVNKIGKFNQFIDLLHWYCPVTYKILYPVLNIQYVHPVPVNRTV